MSFSLNLEYFMNLIPREYREIAAIELIAEREQWRNW